MLGALQYAGKALDDVIGWRRIGFALCVAVIVFSLTVVYGVLKNLQFEDIVAALRKTDAHDVIIAALCLFGVFAVLTAYDFFALRTIGKPNVPYRVAALSGFASFSIGHNVGAVLVTSAAIRYRVYSEWGLSALDVAKVCFVTGLTFWLGNACILGLAIIAEPGAASAIDGLHPMLNRGLAAAALILVGIYLAWLRQRSRTIRIGDWTLTLPSAELTLLQIAIGVVDLLLCSLAMYFLMPDEPQLAFLQFVVVFVSATLFGFLSHAPSGLGVFDAVMLVAFPQFAAGELVASILLFRLMYYVVPLLIALFLLGGREIWLAWSGAPKT